MPSSSATTQANNAGSPLFLGIDVGGTNIKFGVVNDAGKVAVDAQIETNQEAGPQDGIERTRAAVEEMLTEAGLKLADIARIGLATPGTMDIPKGWILEPHNLPNWYHFPIREATAKEFGLPVSYANDANSAAYGEFWVGSGKVFHSIVMLTLGTGVGGGIIIGDLSIDGENSHGSECGHIIIDCNPTARICPCGQPGHLEGYCSATALDKRTTEMLDAGRQSTLSGRIGQEELTALMIAQEAEKGDELSLELVLELANYLGFGVVSLMHTIDPGAVILGGAMNFGAHKSPLGRRFIEHVRGIVRKYAFPIPAQRTTIDYAMLGGEAGFIGAAGIARLDFHKNK
jgi:glucokinase